MDKIRYDNENGSHKYSREFFLTRDFTTDDFKWIIRIDRVHDHHDLRIGYIDHDSLHEVFQIDHVGNMYVDGIEGIVEEQDLEKCLKPIASGKRLYIEATGICKDTKEEAEKLLITYAEGIPNLLGMSKKAV